MHPLQCAVRDTVRAGTAGMACDGTAVSRLGVPITLVEYCLYGDLVQDGKWGLEACPFALLVLIEPCVVAAAEYDEFNIRFPYLGLACHRAPRT